MMKKIILSLVILSGSLALASDDPRTALREQIDALINTLESDYLQNLSKLKCTKRSKC